MNLDNVVHSLKEFLPFSDKGNNSNKKQAPSATTTTPRLAKLLGWFVACQYFTLLAIYIVPLVPLLYYCYRPKKADHLALMDWWRDQLVAKVNQLNQVYIRQGHPPHLFLGGLYGYIVWVTLHQVLPTRFIIWGFGTVWLTCDQWQLTPTLHSYLFPSSDRRPSMVQRALEYQQQFMIHSLDKHTTTTSDPLNFVIYENQRRSPLTGTWHAITLPLERTAWTDDAQATVLPTHQFVLPSPVQLEQAGSEKWVWAWVWVDSDWQHGEWEYGDLVWTLTGQDDGLTRQRKWTRRAILECTVILPQQQKKPKPLVIDSPSHNPSLSSPRPSVISPTESFYRPPLDFSSSQASLLSTKTDDLSLHPSSRDPKRSSSRSTRRQVVWKSIVKT